MTTWDSAARLITLSGCETGVTDVMETPNEFTGLSSGWLRTGALAVISSLWLVDDLCTMLLMLRMYTVLFAEGDQSPALCAFAPANALKIAKLWLKEITAEEVCQQLSEMEERTSLSHEQRALISLRRDELSKLSPLSKPFSEPYWWAGFLCSGI